MHENAFKFNFLVKMKNNLKSNFFHSNSRISKLAPKISGQRFGKRKSGFSTFLFPSLCPKIDRPYFKF